MKRQFDVIIVGAGPAGLECARVLRGASCTVLVLEKNQVIGPKPCAGGIVKSVEPFDIPEQHANQLTRHHIVIGNRIHRFESRMAVHIVDRSNLGAFQLERIEGASNITIRTGVRVRRIREKTVHTTAGNFDFRHLVGADGPLSVVRRYLNLTSQYTVGMYYDMPAVQDHIRISIDGATLGTGYLWEFPHRRFTNVGIHFNPGRLTARKAEEMLRAYMRKKGYPIHGRTYRAFPIMHLYQGCVFPENLYLAGDAAGMASRLTGEGIPYAVISGREVGRRILEPAYGMPRLGLLLRRKQKQDRLSVWFDKVPLGLNLCYHLLFKAFRSNMISWE